jgi:hypothetical protein
MSHVSGSKILNEAFELEIIGWESFSSSSLQGKAAFLLDLLNPAELLFFDQVSPKFECYLIRNHFLNKSFEEQRWQLKVLRRSGSWGSLKKLLRMILGE